MENFSDINLRCLRDRLGGQEHKAAGFFWHKNEFSQMVEFVVDATDPRMRVVSRYQKKLRSPVEVAWQYLQELVKDIPGPLAINKKAYGNDPRVRIFFKSADTMQKVFSNAYDLKEYCANPSSEEFQNGYALLCMQKKENTFFGVDLEGEMLKRDVRQTSVTFYDYQILSAAANEVEARNGFMCCAYEGLLRKAVEIITHSIIKYRDLEERKKELTTELRELQGGDRLASETEASSKSAEVAIHRELDEIKNEIIKVKTETASPENHLGIVTEVLSQPEHYLKVNAISLVLDNMGVKVTEGSAKQGYKIDLAEIEIENTLKRVATVVNYQRNEMC